MVKYCGHYITFQEVPNEVSLVLTISNCPYRCKDCHSPWLRKNIGDELTPEVINELLDKYQGAVTCVCFMGAGRELHSMKKLVEYVESLGLKTCVYTGGEFYEVVDLGSPTYFKEGRYYAELGGLASPTTNQHMWKKNEDGNYENITSWFWRKRE